MNETEGKPDKTPVKIVLKDPSTATAKHRLKKVIRDDRRAIEQAKILTPEQIAARKCLQHKIKNEPDKLNKTKP